MKTRTETITKTVYISDVSGIETENESYKRAIEWADLNPRAWRIVTETRSLAWGKGSPNYLGECATSSQPWAILMRLVLFERYVREAEFPGGKRIGLILTGNAVFAIKHYDEPSYTGGLFRQHDGKHERYCLTLDYTPTTREAWIDYFTKWAEASPAGQVTDHILINGIIVREGCRHPSKTSKDGKIVCTVCQKVVQKLW